MKSVWFYTSLPPDIFMAWCYTQRHLYFVLCFVSRRFYMAYIMVANGEAKRG